MNSKRGFTIVELLIVIVVIAILAAISIVAYNGIQQRARDSKRVSDLAAIEKALKLYGSENDFSVMSAGSSGNEVGWFDGPYSPYISVKQALENAGYLNGNIVDPTNFKSTSVSGVASSAYMIAQCITGNETMRVIMARLENPPSQTVTQQAAPYTCNDSNFGTYTGSPGSGYGMNYVKVVVIK